MSKGCAHFCTILFSRFLGRYAPTNFSHFIRKMNKLLCMFDQSSALQTLQSSIFHTRSLNSTIAAPMAGGPELWGQKSFKFIQIIKLQGVFSLLVPPLKSLKCQLVSVSIHLLCIYYACLVNPALCRVAYFYLKLHTAYRCHQP